MAAMNCTVITGGRVVMPDRIIESGGIVIKDGKIERVFAGEYHPEGGERIINAEGRFISPGFVDLHVHGGGGFDFMCGEADNVISACQFHMRHGTTSIVPTLSAADQQVLVTAIAGITEAKHKMRDGGPEILGLHLEGPYFAMSQKGAQNERYVRDPDPKEYMEIVDKFDTILRWTIAPELPGAVEMAKAMKERGIRMCIGHSDASYDEAVQAYECGFDSIVHFYSCLSTVRRINAYRHAGVVEAGYQLDGMMVEVIADGKHLPQSLLKLIYKVKGPERICLVTDAISVAGLEHIQDEIYSQTSDMNVIIEDSVAKLPDRSAFAGSVATADRLVRVMNALDEVPLYEAVKMASATPARNIGIFDRKGSLSPGKDADILLFDDNINISIVMVNGQITFER